MVRDINMDMICKCGGKGFFTEEHGNQTGLYCSACGKWQKWLKKDDPCLCETFLRYGESP